MPTGFAAMIPSRSMFVSPMFISPMFISTMLSDPLFALTLEMLALAFVLAVFCPLLHMFAMLGFFCGSRVLVPVFFGEC